ncbi:hypothetical protein AGMMS49525_08660 [Bacteroidia bacterium]|nr:hypothetical protein AGMMS49525_08660 [Bacteroidia bacterium]
MGKVNFDELKDKTKLVDEPAVKESFVNTLSKIHGVSTENAEMVFEREAMYFKKALFENAWLKESTGISLYSAFLEIAITGLSIQSGSKSEAYLEARSAKQLIPVIGQDGKPYQQEQWTKVARLVVTAYGELNMRIIAGQIIRMNNPIVIYEGDKFQPKTNSRGELTVEYEPKIIGRSKKIVGVWCSIVLPNNGIDFKWLLEDDIQRLANYSKPKKENSSASALYNSNDGQIDPGFLEAKCIKHAMRAYTKLRLSDSVSFEEEETAAEETKEQRETTFAAQGEEPQTVTVQTQVPNEDDADIPF